ncbi:restriction endonuclease [Olleya sp. HaHaR_3_96]|uniref:restriction endonuclease n=1 Tax=Olleya sp. HaHaR_3_96 TaxID=2745560 RepID=UPI001C4E9A0E|nr:restriction endonuclease [Olleya sp. HaHaR_3_96]QXP59275.1 restriction endonuclease [Olleya sp. HaHaR_3_96]
MADNNIYIKKASGDRVKFSIEKLKTSLINSGADNILADSITKNVRDELFQGISTKEIYNRAFALLKAKQSHLASKYKLKKAIYELGPTGFPFERYVAAIIEASGYTTKVGDIINGHCVKHEIDILATKSNETYVVECKFHSDAGLNCNVKIPLYIYSRFKDVQKKWNTNLKLKTKVTQGWVVTNTRFTEDARRYGNCVGLYLLSWDYPKNNGLKHRIDTHKLYPITVSTLLTKREKQFLLNREVVLCKDLINDAFYLDHLAISKNRKTRILNEIKLLCNQN